MTRSWAKGMAWVAAGLFGGVIVAAGMAAAVPAPAGKGPEKWEYGEVQLRGIREVGGVASAQDTPHWVTGEQDIEADSWEDLATVLKATAAKKGATEESHRLRVFNRLGADGWEFAGHRPAATRRGTEAWLFKRRLR